MDCVEFSIKSIDEKCKVFAELIKSDYTPDVVIYIAKSGYLIGKAVNDIFQVPLLSVGSTRSGDNTKRMMSFLLSRLPRCICNILRFVELKSNIHKKKSHRDVRFLDDISSMDRSSVHNILIIDDSVDTGNSIIAARDLVVQYFPQSEIRLAALNVMKSGLVNVKVDYYIYCDTMLRTPMSKDSKEYNEFCEIYKREVLKKQ